MTETGYFRVIIDKKDKQIEEIEKRNAELKDNLTKAKDLLKKWVELFKTKDGNVPPIPIQIDTEKFLKE